MHEETWRALAAAHAERTDLWIQPRLARRARGESHPIEDFLFEYYPFSPSKLRSWHPGYPVVLEGAGARAFLSHPAYTEVPGGVTVGIGWLHDRIGRLRTAIGILEGTASRPAATGCFGLHEWAMTYGLAQDEVRHSSLALRLTPSTIADTVEHLGLRCTHLDAYRFFTPAAMPLNASMPTRASQAEHEQPGCLHASMDLYKYAFWFSPMVPSTLIADCFENAMRARVLDMRASPYDMAPFDLEPIPVETVEGRRAYVNEQMALVASSEPLRIRLLEVLTGLHGAVEAHSAAHGR